MSDFPDDWKDRERTPIDFLIVGAGAAGAPLAARLVERGYTVLVIEMGPEHPDPPDGPDGQPAPADPTEVPLLHPASTEDPRHSLRFFVKHFEHDPVESRDWKTHPRPVDPPTDRRDEHGVFYPRSQGVGGCAIHNAMITVAGPSEDWDEIAELTGDESWRGVHMRRYFQRFERCHYARPSLWARFKALFTGRTGWEDARHGESGWLDVTLADLRFVKRDRNLLCVVLGAAWGSFKSGAERFGELVHAALLGRVLPALDPNHWVTMRRSPEGISRIPVAIDPNGQRSSPRERLLALKEPDSPHASRLHLKTQACVTGIILDDLSNGQANLRAVGVYCIPRAHIYEADPYASEAPPFPDQDRVPLYCRREVLLCGGTFNTPQLLMLSGIGPADHLHEHGIEPKLDRPDVGRNLQDRYEVPVVATLTDRFRSLDGLTLSLDDPDPILRRWIDNPDLPAYRRGIYSTNGGLIGLFVRSRQEEQSPDLFLFALAGYFPGYFVGYSEPAVQLRGLDENGTPRPRPDGDDGPSRSTQLTWLVLKARTRHRDGYVRLHCGNPLRRPEINFNSFPENDDGDDPDLEAILEGIEVVERILQIGQDHGTIASIEKPRIDDFDGNVRAWIKHTAWGHHACGTCRIGADDDPDAVLDSRFRVRGVAGLRVVDASVFPRIPGFFIVANVYTIAEKAADVIAEDHPIPTEELPLEAREERERHPIYPSRVGHRARKAYPVALEEAEAQLIAHRRTAAGLVATSHEGSD